MIIYESRFLTTNANLYLYGTAANLTSSYTFIRKQDVNDSVIWTKNIYYISDHLSWI